MNVVVQIRQYRKGVLVCYVDEETGEILYDMEFTPVSGGLTAIIAGIKRMHAGMFDGASLLWDVRYAE